MISSVSVMSSPNLRSRALPQHRQAVGAGSTTRSRGRCAGKGWRAGVRSLVEAFLETWQLDRTSVAWPTRRAEWVNALLERKLTLRDLIDQTSRRYAELQQT